MTELDNLLQVVFMEDSDFTVYGSAQVGKNLVVLYHYDHIVLEVYETIDSYGNVEIEYTDLGEVDGIDIDPIENRHWQTNYPDEEVWALFSQIVAKYA